MIYFVLGEKTRKIKIGYTANFMEERMRSLRSSSPDKLIFLGGMAGDRHLERTIQEKFKMHKSHGEWFYENDALNNFIKTRTIHCNKCVELVEISINNGELNWEQALSLSGNEILDLGRERLSHVFNNIYKSVNSLGENSNKHHINKDRPEMKLTEKSAHKDRL